jgi:hypothetical protein
MSGNQITIGSRRLKTVSVGLAYFQHPLKRKRQNRRTFYHYTKAIKDENFGQIKDHIQLEINAFTNRFHTRRKLFNLIWAVSGY